MTGPAYTPGMDDFRAAQTRLKDVVSPTPLLESHVVNERLGGRLFLKAENMQRSGAFKIRGAYNRIAQMSEVEKQRGVITYSSGNHAQGVAMAGQLLGTSAIIVMPEDAPEAKKAITRALGAEVVTFDRDTEDSDEVVAKLSAETGRIIVPPSADPRVLAGAGTAALEVFDQLSGLGLVPDDILVPCGGGGLTAATALVAEAVSPRTNTFAMEPEAFDDTRRSLVAGKRLPNPKGIRTICDSIMTPVPNEVTFPINFRLLNGGLVASDQAVCDAMHVVYDIFKMVAEPGAVVGLAAILNGELDIKGRTVVTYLTGGNIDPDRFHDLLGRVSGYGG